MEDDLNFLGNGRQTQYCGKWKTISIFCPIIWKMEDDLNIYQMEDDPTILANGRQPQYLGK